MRLYLLGSLALAALSLILVLGGPTGAPIPSIAVFILLTAASWLAAIEAGKSGSGLIFIWAIAILLRCMALFLDPGSDLYRYLWEGKIQTYGWNPYAHAPDDPLLASLRDADAGKINHPGWTAIYGPLFLLLSAGLSALWHSPWTFKLLFVVLDITLLTVLGSGRKPRPERRSAVAGYGWSPLPLFFVAGEGHNEIVWLLPFVWGLRAIQTGGRGWAAIAFGIAVAIKPTALVAILFALPAIPPRFWAAVALVPAVFAVPYLGAASGLVRSLATFAGQALANDLMPFLLSAALVPLFGYHVSRYAVRGLGMLALGWLWCRKRPVARTDPESCALDGMGTFLLVSPIVHAWYALPVAALAAGRPQSRWWWLAGGMAFYFLGYTTPAADPWLMRALTYGPILAALAAGSASRFLRPRRDRGAIEKAEMLPGGAHGEIAR